MNICWIQPHLRGQTILPLCPLARLRFDQIRRVLLYSAAVLRPGLNCRKDTWSPRRLPPKLWPHRCPRQV